MAAGSSLSAVQSALKTVLEARPALATVPVTIGGPKKAEDLQTSTGTWEAVWLEGARTQSIEPPFVGTPVQLDERYTLDIVIQVLKASPDQDTQEAATTRAEVLLGEVVGALAADPDLTVTTSSTLLFVEALPIGWEFTPGWLGTGDQHAARFVVTVAVHARLALT